MTKPLKISKIQKVVERKLKAKVDMSKVPRKVLNEGADGAIEAMKILIAKGISPIKKRSRFERYKKPKKYPGDRKKQRPVNLKLTGKFLKLLKRRTRKGKNASIRIGFFKKYGKDLESGHREGVNGQPKRPIIPNENESFKPQVEKPIIEALVKYFKKKK